MSSSSSNSSRPTIVFQTDDENKTVACRINVPQVLLEWMCEDTDKVFNPDIYDELGYYHAGWEVIINKKYKHPRVIEHAIEISTTLPDGNERDDLLQGSLQAPPESLMGNHLWVFKEKTLKVLRDQVFEHAADEYCRQKKTITKQQAYDVLSFMEDKNYEEANRLLMEMIKPPMDTKDVVGWFRVIDDIEIVSFLLYLEERTVEQILVTKKKSFTATNGWTLRVLAPSASALLSEEVSSIDEKARCITGDLFSLSLGKYQWQATRSAVEAINQLLCEANDKCLPPP